MTTLETLRAELVADAAVTALVAGRIYAQVVPQSAPSPAVVMTVISEALGHTLTGAVATQMVISRVQVDVYAAGYLAAHQVADAVTGVLGNLSRADLSAQRDSLQDLYEQETKEHRVSMDFTVWR